MAFRPRNPKLLILVNLLTLSRLIAGIASVVAFFSEPLKPFLALLFFYILVSDLLDGALARGLGVATRAGGIFDYVVDRFNSYLIISILLHEGISPLLFLAYFLRDLLYVSVQAYITMPSVRGTKAATFGGISAAYLYVIFINYLRRRSSALELVLLLASMLPLTNIVVRIVRLRTVLLQRLREDLEGNAT
jgi:phosphatidylglycerophosphate synthase